MHVPTSRPAGHKPRRRLLPALDQVKLDSLRIDQLQEAIRANRVNFPAPVPTFERHDGARMQCKLVHLYFIVGWRCEGIAKRYGLLRQRVRQILKTWKRRAVEDETHRVHSPRRKPVAGRS